MRLKLIALTGLALASCSNLNTADSSRQSAKPAVPPWGFELAYMDTSVKPGDDFFRYTVGSWLKTAQIAPDRSYAGAVLDLRMRSEQQLKTIFAELAARDNASLSDEERKLRDLYAAFTDEAAIEAAGLGPAQADLDRITTAKNHEDIARLIGDPALSLDGPFSFGIGIDDKKPEAYAVFFFQSGLGLPDRDYYTQKQFAEARDAYKKYLEDLLTLAGYSNAQSRAAAIYSLEAKIAKVQWPAEDQRQADKVYNPMSLTELEKFAGKFPWRAAIGEAGISETSASGERQLIIAEKSAFPKLATIFAATPVAVWRDYLVTRYLHANAAFLPKKFDDLDFAFFGTSLFGNAKQLDRATRAGRLIDGTMGEALGKIYVAKYFPPDAKAKAEALVSNVIKAYDQDIRSLDWMTDETRQHALEKLSKVGLKIGYPNKWRDYSALEIDRSNLVRSVENTRTFEWNRELKRLDDPVDRTEWHISPPTINAYYSASLNEIVFPAAFLQPPLFDPAADDAVNYGGIGSVVGHELSHGFDDQGSKYDATGKLENWWTDADRANYDARTKVLADQFNKFEVLPGLFVRGDLTLGENIADLAGEVIALKAYHLSLNGKQSPVLDGLSGDQRFYLGRAGFYRSVEREGRKRALNSDVHSPDEFRVNGIMPNDDSWYAAFGVQPGDKLYIAPDQRVHLW